MHRRSEFRQYSILSHKPTHFRVKSQLCSLNQNSSSEKNLTFKKPIKNVRINEFQERITQKQSNQALRGEKSPAQRSLFGQNNEHIPKFRKQTICDQSVDLPLKDYIKMIKPKQVRKNIKRYKTTCDPSTSISKPSQQHLTMVPLRKLQSQFSPQKPKKDQLQLFNIVDEIYKKINRFKQVGFNEKKINDWIQKYCFQKRRYMIDLFMKSTNKHKLADTIQDYVYQKDPKKVKQKLSFVKKTINGKVKLIDQYDLLQFSNYIEEILVHKNKNKLSELKDSISDKLSDCFVYNRQKNQSQFAKRLYPSNMINFISDLNEIEQKYGNFTNISSFNRQYFKDLGNTENDIRRKITQLIKITQVKKDLKPQRNLTKSSTVKLQRNYARQSQFQQTPNIIEVEDFTEQCLQ